MPQRPSAMDRVPELVDAAAKVFAEKGYRATQMADVAASMGVAAGSLYNYVDSKEGLFALCLERMMHQDRPLQVTLPFVAPPLDVTLKRVDERVRELLRLPALSSRAGGEPSPARAEEELRAVVTELFDVFSRTRLAVDMIERSARDLPALAALFYDQWRAPLVGRLDHFLRSRMDRGELRRVDDVAVAARFVLEGVVWFARHRFHDVDAYRLDEAPVRATVTGLIVSAFALRRPQDDERLPR